MASIEVLNPYSSDSIHTLELSSNEVAFAKLEKANALYQKHPKGLSKEKRISILEKFYEKFYEAKEALIQLAVLEGAKPLNDTEVEFNRALEGIKLGVQAVRSIIGEQVPMNLNTASTNKLAYTIKSPIGVVLSISAFNHPINLAIHQIVPAIASGCPVIYKPALTTPLVSKKIIELIYDSGLPREWCTYLVCENETTAKLAQSPLLGYISFIGSSKIGWNIKAKIAPGVKIALEHGGNAPTILRADANLKLAIPQIAKAGFYHAGQVCVSAQRIYVHDTICDSFVAQINRLAQTQKLGNPLSVETEIGPLISDTSLNRINKWVQDAIDEGATLIAGGNKLQNNCYEPTILLNPLEKSKVTKEEIFGPVICIYSFSSDEEAIKRANNSRYCFQSAVFTESLNKALKYTQDLNGSTVLINSHPAFRVDWMPFGGQGLSGDGLGGISYSTEEMLKQKLIIIAEN